MTNDTVPRISLRIRNRKIVTLHSRSPLYSVVLLQLPASELLLCPLIIPRHGPHGGHFPSVVLECVFIGPLPSDGCPIESVNPGVCLPSRCLAMIICVTVI
jgi:hypothetical protein